MNILHISDLHFGSWHWQGNDSLLLEKLNSLEADIVINTGDSTCEALESEFEAASHFLQKIECQNLISIMGNHDKLHGRGSEFFKKYIDHPELIYPLNPEKVSKSGLFIKLRFHNVFENYTDVSFVRTVSVAGKTVLIIGVDSIVMLRHRGYVEVEVLNAIAEQIRDMNYDECLLLCHHSVLGTDEAPFDNSLRLTDFIDKHNIAHVFCGHTHELSIRQSINLYRPHSFTQYMCGSSSSTDLVRESNMFLFYENFGSHQMKIHITRMFPEKETLRFEEEIIPVHVPPG